MRGGSLSVGAVLGRGFPIWFANALPFVLLSTIVMLPSIFVAFMTYQGTLDPDSATVVFGAGLYALLAPQFINATVIYGTIQQLRGEHASIGASLSFGMSRLIKVLAVALVSGICQGGAAFAILVPAVLLFFVGEGFGILAGLAGIPFIFYVVLGLWVAVPVAVMENRSIVESIKRSWQLTSGHRFKIFGVVFVVGLIVGLATTILSGVMSDPRSGPLIETIINVLSLSLMAVFNALIYHDLRTSRDGVDTAKLASIFD